MKSLLSFCICVLFSSLLQATNYDIPQIVRDTPLPFPWGKVPVSLNCGQLGGLWEANTSLNTIRLNITVIPRGDDSCYIQVWKFDRKQVADLSYGYAIAEHKQPRIIVRLQGNKESFLTLSPVVLRFPHNNETSTVFQKSAQTQGYKLQDFAGIPSIVMVPSMMGTVIWFNDRGESHKDFLVLNKISSK